MHTVEHRIGRLFEARVFGLATLADIDAYTSEFTDELLAGESRPVLCADHRPVHIYSPTIADLLVDLFSTMNSRWHRVAILVAPTNATLAMQLQRIVRESGNPARRVFFEAAHATDYLQEVLTPLEIARVIDFLAEPFTTGGSTGRPAR